MAFALNVLIINYFNKKPQLFSSYSVQDPEDQGKTKTPSLLLIYSLLKLPNVVIMYRFVFSE